MFVAGQGGTIEGAIRWSDLALAVSGTVSLDCTRQGKPMIGVYRTSRLEALGAKLVIRARHLLLPNIIAGRRIVPEFVPFAGRAGQITDCALAMLENPERLARTSADLRVVAASFLGRDPARIASEVAFRSALGERLGNAELDAIVESGTSSPDVS
jgi:lipid-A-disaccharide synthase